MSDQDNMFTDTTITEQPTTTQVPEFLAEFVGDDKKYKTTEDALKSVPNAHAHIDRLEQELKDLKAGSDKDELMNDIERKLLEKMQAGETKPLETPDIQPVAPADPAPATLDLDDVMHRVKSMLNQEQTEKQAELQQKSVVQAAINAWGGDAEKNLYGKAAEVGMDAQSIDALAATNPQAALKILGINAKPQGTAPLQGNINTQANTYTNSMQLPKEPVNWGNDDELVPYIRAMAEYEAAGGKL